MGQSLGAGVESLPIITDSITGYGNLKFRMGIHTWAYNYFPNNPNLRSLDNFDFVSLTADRRVVEGETIANGLCDYFTEKSKINGKLLFSYAGQGGRYLRELDKRHDDAKDERAGRRKSKGGYYKTSINDVLRAKQKADSLSLTYNVMAITWMQGESNNTRKLNRWDEALPRKEFLHAYKNDLIQLKKDYDTDISNILGKEIKIPFFTYQTVGTMSGTAQLLATDENPNMYMVGPIYMMPNAENTVYDYRGKKYHGDGIHLTADSQRWLGEQFGKVIKRVLIDKEDWQPLRPLKAYSSKNKKQIYVKFHVPRLPLVLDTLFLPKQGQAYGFRIYDINKKVIPIKSTKVIDGNTIQLSLENEIDKETYISYGTRSHIKDLSEPIYKIFDSGINEYGFKEISIEFKGNFIDEFSILLDEGVFYLGNRVKNSSEFTDLIIRNVYVNNAGNTVLSGELEDLRKNVPFTIGQSCYISRRYVYGNLRDSDNEKSIFKFSDTNYGKRGNMNYPLFNWCISFQDLRIKEN